MLVLTDEELAQMRENAEAVEDENLLLALRELERNRVLLRQMCAADALLMTPGVKAPTETVRKHLHAMRDEIAVLACECNKAGYIDDATRAQTAVQAIHALCDSGHEFEYAAWPPRAFFRKSLGGMDLISAAAVDAGTTE